MYSVDPARCTGCGDCVEACPIEAIELLNGLAHIDAGACVECGACADACRRRAISLSADADTQAAGAPIEVHVRGALLPEPAGPSEPVYRISGEVLPAEDRRSASWALIGSALLWATREVLPVALRIWRARPFPVTGALTARRLNATQDDRSGPHEGRHRRRGRRGNRA